MAPVIGASTRPCRFGSSCQSASCRFVHPAAAASENKTPNAGISAVNDIEHSPSSSTQEEQVIAADSACKKKTMTKKCRFGSSCNRKNCKFVHPVPATADSGDPASSKPSTRTPFDDLTPPSKPVETHASPTKDNHLKDVIATLASEKASKAPKYASTSQTNDVPASKAKPCHFGVKCNRKATCKFSHPESISEAPTPKQPTAASKKKDVTVKVNEVASPLPPAATGQQQEQQQTKPSVQSSGNNKTNANNTPKVCHFGLHCKNKKCKLKHVVEFGLQPQPATAVSITSSNTDMSSISAVFVTDLEANVERDSQKQQQQRQKQRNVAPAPSHAKHVDEDHLQDELDMLLQEQERQRQWEFANGANDATVMSVQQAARVEKEYQEREQQRKQAELQVHLVGIQQQQQMGKRNVEAQAKLNANSIRKHQQSHLHASQNVSTNGRIAVVPQAQSELGQQQGAKKSAQETIVPPKGQLKIEQTTHAAHAKVQTKHTEQQKPKKNAHDVKEQPRQNPTNNDHPKTKVQSQLVDSTTQSVSLPTTIKGELKADVKPAKDKPTYQNDPATVSKKGSLKSAEKPSQSVGLKTGLSEATQKLPAQKHVNVDKSSVQQSSIIEKRATSAKRRELTATGKWLLDLCSRISSELGTAMLVRSIWEISFIKDDIQLQTKLFDVLGASEEAMSVMEQVIPRLQHIQVDIKTEELSAIVELQQEQQNSSVTPTETCSGSADDAGGKFGSEDQAKTGENMESEEMVRYREARNAAKKERKRLEKEAKMRQQMEKDTQGNDVYEDIPEDVAASIYELNAKEKEREEELKRQIQEELRVSRERAVERKNLKQERQKKAQEQAVQRFEERSLFWRAEISKEIETVGFIKKLCLAEFKRVNKFDPAPLRKSASAMEKLEVAAHETYRAIYKAEICNRVVVKEMKQHDLNERTGVILSWDASKGSFKVALDSKKSSSKFETYIPPGNLEHIPEKNTAKKKKQVDPVHMVFIANLWQGGGIMTEIFKSEINNMKNAVDVDRYLSLLMQRRDEEERELRAAAEELRRQEEEQRRRRAEQRQREAEEAHERQRQYEAQRARYAFGGGSSHGRNCRCPMCQVKREFFSHFTFHFSFGRDYDSDSDEYFDEDEDWDHYNARETAAKDSAAALVLGVPVDASEAQVKAAYRRLALKFHPDKYREGEHEMSREDAAERFKEINNANDRLMSHFD